MPRVGDTEVRGGFIWRYTETDQVDDEDDPELEWRNTLMRPRSVEGGERTSKDEREAKARENWIKGGYGNIKLKDPRRKNEKKPIFRDGSWGAYFVSRLENSIIGKTASLIRKALKWLDEITTDPGTKASRWMDRRKENRKRKRAARARQKRFQAYLMTPEGQEELERRKAEKRGAGKPEEQWWK